MKKTLLTLALVAASLAAYAQGKIQLGNDSNHFFVLGSTLGPDSALGGGVTNAGSTNGAIPVSPLPSGDSLVVVLYGGNGTAGNNLTVQTSYVLSGANWGPQPGRMASKSVTLPTVAGNPNVATFDVVIVDDKTSVLLGSAYSALTKVDYFGESGFFTATPGSSITFPSILPGSASSSTWTAANLVINAIPEPGTFALLGLGAAAMLIFRRRK